MNIIRRSVIKLLALALVPGSAFASEMSLSGSTTVLSTLMQPNQEQIQTASATTLKSGWQWVEPWN